jgi:chromate transporter
MSEAKPHGVPFGEAMKVWLRVAALSFGGPAGQIAVMHRIIVEEKKWIGEQRFLQALNYCTLLPGPEAQQLATYIGWLMHRTAGGLLAGTLFVLPGLVAIMALSWVYVLLGKVTLVQGLFFGLKAAVLVIVIEAVIRVGRRALRNNAMRLLAAAAFVAIFFYGVPFPLIVIGAGLIGFIATKLGRSEFQAGGHGAGGHAGLGDAQSLLGEATPEHARPNLRWTLSIGAIFLILWLAPVGLLWLLRGPDDVFTQIAVFFSKMAVVTFGGAYAVLAYVAQQAVEQYGWVTAGEMLDGLGLAESTPGPLIMVTQFVGFLGAWRDPGGLPPLLAGTLGGLLTTWGHVRALLPVDLRRRALCRGAAVQQGAVRRAGGHHLGGRGRDPEPRRLVRAAGPVRRAAPAQPARRHPRCAGPGVGERPQPSHWRQPVRLLYSRFRFGMIPVLLASSMAGIVYALML